MHELSEHRGRLNKIPTAGKRVNSGYVSVKIPVELVAPGRLNMI